MRRQYSLFAPILQEGGNLINSEIEKLLAEKAAGEQKAEQLQHQINRYENRLTYYAQSERRRRAHRLITRGAAIESISPFLQETSEMEFYAMMERILNMPAVVRELRSMQQEMEEH